MDLAGAEGVAEIGQPGSTLLEQIQFEIALHDAFEVATDLFRLAEGGRHDEDGDGGMGLAQAVDVGAAALVFAENVMELVDD